MHFITFAIIFFNAFLNTFQTYPNFAAYISRLGYDYFADH